MSFCLFKITDILRKKVCSTDDHASIPSASSQHTSHSSPSHHQHLNIITSGNYHVQQQHATIPTATIPPAHHLQAVDIANPSNVSTSYSEELYSAADFGEVGQSEHYIYVTYPPELKRRLLERYGRDIYLMLLKKDTW